MVIPFTPLSSIEGSKEGSNVFCIGGENMSSKRYFNTGLLNILLSADVVS